MEDVAATQQYFCYLLPDSNMPGHIQYFVQDPLTVECLTVPLWYKQQVTFLNPKFNQIPMEIANFLLLFGP